LAADGAGGGYKDKLPQPGSCTLREKKLSELTCHN
jgi:hypothetical protein